MGGHSVGKPLGAQASSRPGIRGFVTTLPGQFQSPQPTSSSMTLGLALLLSSPDLRNWLALVVHTVIQACGQ